MLETSSFQETDLLWSRQSFISSWLESDQEAFAAFTGIIDLIRIEYLIFLSAFCLLFRRRSPSPSQKPARNRTDLLPGLLISNCNGSTSFLLRVLICCKLLGQRLFTLRYYIFCMPALSASSISTGMPAASLHVFSHLLCYFFIFTDQAVPDDTSSCRSVCHRKSSKQKLCLSSLRGKTWYRVLPSGNKDSAPLSAGAPPHSQQTDSPSLLLSSMLLQRTLYFPCIKILQHLRPDPWLSPFTSAAAKAMPY